MRSVFLAVALGSLSLLLSNSAFATALANTQVVHQPASPLMTLSITGSAAKSVYDHLSILPIPEDAEGYNFWKSATGVLCQYHSLPNSYECIIVVSSDQGVLQ